MARDCAARARASRLLPLLALGLLLGERQRDAIAQRAAGASAIADRAAEPRRERPLALELAQGRARDLDLEVARRAACHASGDVRQRLRLALLLLACGACRAARCLQLGAHGAGVAG